MTKNGTIENNCIFDDVCGWVDIQSDMGKHLVENHSKKSVNVLPDKNSWTTPKQLARNICREFELNVDLACTVENCICDIGFTKDGRFIRKINGDMDVSFFSEAFGLDSLHKSWDNLRGFLNPPHSPDRESKTTIYDWIKKASEAKNSTIVMLIPNAPETKAWQEFIFPSAVAVVNMSPRLRYCYIDENGEEKEGDSPRFPSALVVFDEWNDDYDTKIAIALTNLGFKRSSGKFWYGDWRKINDFTRR